MPTTNRTGLTFAALLGVALLASCAEDTAQDQEHEADFNQADIAFAQEMIPHHEQAVDMAEMVPDRTDDQELLDLAADVEAAQDPEIEAMNGMLEQWGEPLPDAHDEHDGHDAHEMPGMMSEQQMANLAETSGTEFDRLWTEMMIEHHEGAIEMAENQLAEGTNSDAGELAEDIVEVQEAEIAQMQEMLE